MRFLGPNERESTEQRSRIQDGPAGLLTEKEAAGWPPIPSASWWPRARGSGCWAEISLLLSLCWTGVHVAWPAIHTCATGIRARSRANERLTGGPQWQAFRYFWTTCSTCFPGNGTVIFFQPSDWEIKLGWINVLPLRVNVCDRFASLVCRCVDNLFY